MTLPPIPLLRLPGGDLGCRIGGELVRVVPNHADRRRLRYWRCVSLTGAPLSPWASTPGVAAALATARIAVAAGGRGCPSPK